jgi:magnesium-transporting ATPase (P-type)
MYRYIKKKRINVNERVFSLKDVDLFNQVIAVEGATLALIIEDQELQDLFFHIAIRSKSVVCCRMSPKQKADIVYIFKSRGPWITLAIGDGANDVSMIMEAHIGVGIKGKEGTQAVRSADFAISQFQFLLRLLVFQGRNGYSRVSSMICYYFYKNIVLVLTEFYFALFNGFSGQIFFMDWLPMLYNAVFTSWHCLFTLLLEKDVNYDYSFRYP